MRRPVQTMQTPDPDLPATFGSAAVCLLESVRVTVFEREVPTLLIAGPLLLEILLSHHVQLGVGRQDCLRRRLLSRFQPDDGNIYGKLRSRSEQSPVGNNFVTI